MKIKKIVIALIFILVAFIGINVTAKDYNIWTGENQSPQQTYSNTKYWANNISYVADGTGGGTVVYHKGIGDNIAWCLGKRTSTVTNGETYSTMPSSHNKYYMRAAIGALINEVKAINELKGVSDDETHSSTQTFYASSNVQWAIWRYLVNAGFTDIVNTDSGIYKCSANANGGNGKFESDYNSCDFLTYVTKKGLDKAAEITSKLSHTFDATVSEDTLEFDYNSSTSKYESNVITVTTSRDALDFDNMTCQVSNASGVTNTSSIDIDITPVDQKHQTLQVLIPVSAVNDAVSMTLNCTVNSESYDLANQLVSSNTSHQDIVTMYEKTTENKTKSLTFSGSFASNGLTIETRRTEKNTLINGAKYSLYIDSSCQTLATNPSSGVAYLDNQSATNGTLSISGLFSGTYYIKQTTTPDNYQPVEQIKKFKYSEGLVATCASLDDTECTSTKSNTITFLNTAQVGSIVIKKAKTNNELVGGAKYRIYKNQDLDIEATNLDGAEYGEIVATLGSIELEELPYGTYYIKEVESPSGMDSLYNVVVISISQNGITLMSTHDNLPNGLNVIESNNITFYATTSNIKVSIRNMVSGDEIPGTLFKITCDGGFKKEWTSGNNPEDITVPEGAVCTLKELEPAVLFHNVEGDFQFKVENSSLISITDLTENKYFAINGNTIIVKNLRDDSNTGATTSIIVIVCGLILVGSGSYLVYKNTKKNKF